MSTKAITVVRTCSTDSLICHEAAVPNLPCGLWKAPEVDLEVLFLHRLEEKLGVLYSIGGCMAHCMGSSESKSEKRNCQSPLSQSHRLANGKMEIVFIVVDKCNFGEFDYRTTLSLHTASYGFFLTPPFFNKESQISHPAAICYRGRRNFVVPFTWWYVCFRIWTLRYCA